MFGRGYANGDAVANVPSFSIGMRRIAQEEELSESYWELLGSISVLQFLEGFWPFHITVRELTGVLHFDRFVNFEFPPTYQE